MSPSTRPSTRPSSGSALSLALAILMPASRYSAALILAMSSLIFTPPLHAQTKQDDNLQEDRDNTDASAVTVYERQLKPILKARCYACHGALKQEADLRLDTGGLIRKGSASGEIIDLQSPQDSPLLERLRSKDEDHRMPPIGEPLSEQQIELFGVWITGGGKSPANEAPEEDPSEHWAFQPLQRPTPPAESKAHPIDAFLAARYRQNGLKPVAAAAPARVLRRLYLDLTGLPPTREELQEFLSDPSPKHYAEIVDRLLDSPRYGERWARHWMDIWRYSDWYGRRQVNDVRNSAPQIWRWRDWIIRSLNDDKGYDRMLQEMLAADEIAPDDDSAWPATGYLVRSYYSLNPNEWMRHNVEYTGKAFLGLTFNCAHCHDHKYDPIEHDDYFRLRAFFEPLGIRQDRVVGEPEPPAFERYKYGGSRKAVQLGMVRVYDENPDAKTWFYAGGDERNRMEERGGIEPGVPSFLNVPLPPIETIELPMSAWYPGSRKGIQAAELRDRQAALESAQKQFQDAEKANVDTSDAEKRLRSAKRALDSALTTARETGAGALSGQQSLLINSMQGRRILQNELPGLKTLNEDARFEFQLRILKDDHFNFQLARDTSKGLTALYLGFVKGKIQAYKPGGFSVFELADYDAPAEGHTFAVALQIQPSKDQALVSIRAGEDQSLLVDQQAIALNGWNPTKNAHQPFTLDCRPGTKVLLDEIRFQSGEQDFRWDFEGPDFKDGQDIVGVRGWKAHAQSTSPALSLVSMTGANPKVNAAYQEWKTAESALAGLMLKVDAARQLVEARQLQLQSLRNTIAADNALRQTSAPNNAHNKQAKLAALAREAAEGQAKANLAQAVWAKMDAQIQLAAAQALADSDKSKAKKVKDLQAKLAAARKQRSLAKEEVAKSQSAEQQAANQADRHSKLAKYERLSPTTSRTSTGRRAALARWITDRRNPLTPRVAINHIWMRHFGAPLVASVYDFGRNGKHPSHPKLLDWLAVELVENNWSMKHVHRLIVTSRTYQMDSTAGDAEANLKLDKDNRLLWRRPRQRMEAEMIRDSVLSIAGSLEGKIGGQSLPTKSADSTFRRSMYYEVYPEAGGVIDIARLFDAANPNECYRRASTIIPQQALALSNSKMVHAASSATAKRLAENAKTDSEFIDAAFEAILSRPVIAAEREACQRFLGKQRKLTSDEIAVKTSLVRVLFNHNDFVTIR